MINLWQDWLRERSRRVEDKMVIYLHDDSKRERIYEGGSRIKLGLGEKECEAIVEYMVICSVQPVNFSGMAIHSLPSGEQVILRDGVPVSVERASPRLSRIMREINPRW
jgi:hypothetical protein